MAVENQQAREQWRKEYLEKSQDYAASHFIQQIGNSPIHPKVAKVVELHDRLSNAHSSLPLA